ncbi:phospholipase D-like domain-containing protein [Daejeonella lutea]|uniref:PLD-like domain-containing protein n=1 Tax=Daejeonella lutea TaxID=572036 RepID=A0A1T5B0M0_9SPHI|nr:phospholipase D-like domain-containing protein [Daejeonella lutea]SKB40808.1 PLD-like domain-containing protein [Daejeonella lutea]
MLKIITNDRQPSHLSLLNELLKDADDVSIAVAFLKVEGLKVLLPYFQTKTRFRIITGPNFGITDPAALEVLLEKSSSSNVFGYLNSLSSKTTFHPKMYLIRHKKIGHIIIGSTNLTAGGLSKNNECSLYYTCNVSEKIWQEAQTEFDNFIAPSNAELLNDRIISIYKTYYKRQKPLNEKIEPYPDVDSNPFYNLEKLRSKFDKLDHKKLRKEFAEKMKHYGVARKVLDEIIESKHSSKKFSDLVNDLVGKKGTRGFWYSNGMFRHKTKIFKQQSKFQQLIRSIKNDIGQPAALVYSNARAIEKKINGVGPNFIGEIMMTYDYKNYANINRNPITVLIEEGSVDLKNHSQRFKGRDYEHYVNIVKEISVKLGLKNMLEADHFFNGIYQDLKGSRKYGVK